MKSKAVGHSNVETLALYSTGDVNPWTRFRVTRHLAQCADCRLVVDRFNSAAENLRHDAKAQTLTGFEAIADWQRLEREMMGNIAVGVAASRCIVDRPRARFGNWRGALVGVTLSAMFLAGWFYNIPKEQTDRLSASIRGFMGFETPQLAGTIVQSIPGGIAVRAQGATLTMLHPASAVITIAGASSVGASYVDEESGEITIANVYGQ